MFVWRDSYDLDYLGRNSKKRSAPPGEILDWCQANEIPIVASPSDEGFFLDPQDDVQRMAIKVRWA